MSPFPHVDALKSESDILELRRWNSGVCLYLSHSLSHSSVVEGRRIPLKPGFHSVIERPDSVSRVRPPTTTIAYTRKASEKRWIARTGLETNGAEDEDESMREVVDSEAGLVSIEEEAGEIIAVD